MTQKAKRADGRRVQTTGRRKRQTLKQNKEGGKLTNDNKSLKGGKEELQLRSSARIPGRKKRGKKINFGVPILQKRRGSLGAC